MSTKLVVNFHDYLGSIWRAHINVDTATGCFYVTGNDICSARGYALTGPVCDSIANLITKKLALHDEYIAVLHARTLVENTVIDIVVT